MDRGMDRATTNPDKYRTEVPTNNRGDSTRAPTRRTNRHNDPNRTRNNDHLSAIPRHSLHHRDAGQKQGSKREEKTEQHQE
jgi:hypothetical protein